MSNRFWQSLEAQIHGAVRRAVWDRVLDSGPGSQFLMPVPGIVDSVACDNTHKGHHCKYRIVEHEDGQIVGICDLGYCPRTTFAREDLAKFAMDGAGIARGLAQVLKITPGIIPLSGPGQNLRLGSLLGRTSVPVVFSRQRASSDLEHFLISYFAEHTQPIVLLLPTARKLTDKAATILQHKNSHFYILEGNLELKGPGFEPTDIGHRRWCSIVDPLVGIGGADLGLAIPANAKWEWLTLTFKDNHTISASINGKSRRFTYVDMGMLDKRTDLPDQQWSLLESFAYDYGSIDWHSPSASRKNKKRKQRLANTLKDFFKIAGEPFTYNKDTKGWDAAFTISPH